MRNGLVNAMLTSRKGASKENDHESWQWGAFENLSIDSHLENRLSNNSGAETPTLADSPDGSLKHLISPSTTASSPESSSSPRSGGMCANPFGGGAEASGYHRRLKKEKNGDGGKEKDAMAYDCKGEFRPSRWDSGRWTVGSNSFEDGSSSHISRPRGNGACKCAAGLTADVAVVCCCPFALLHLLAIAFIKLPAAVVTRTVGNIKGKFAEKRQRAAVHEEEDDLNTPQSSFPPSRARSYGAQESQSWAPVLAFGDQKLWRDYFDSPDVSGVLGPGEPLRAKS